MDIKSKISKLLALAGDTAASMNEVTAALSKARALMDKHQITEADLETHTGATALVECRLGVSQFWEKVIVSSVCNLYDCTSIVEQWAPRERYKSTVVGLKDDVEMAAVAALRIIAIGKEGAKSEVGGYGRKAHTAYLEGYALDIRDRLEILEKERSIHSDTEALVLRKKDIIAAELGDLPTRTHIKDPPSEATTILASRLGMQKASRTDLEPSIS